MKPATLRRLFQTHLPSRTFALSRLTVFLLFLLGLVAAWTSARMPQNAEVICSLFQTIALAMATASAVGAGGLAARDSMSRGLTSSQGEIVRTAPLNESSSAEDLPALLPFNPREPQK